MFKKLRYKLADWLTNGRLTQLKSDREKALKEAGSAIFKYNMALKENAACDETAISTQIKDMLRRSIIHSVGNKSVWDRQQWETAIHLIDCAVENMARSGREKFYVHRALPHDGHVAMVDIRIPETRLRLQTGIDVAAFGKG